MRNALVSVAGAALVLAACGGGSSGDTGTAEPADAPTGEVATGEVATSALSLANGGTVELDSLAGQDVLLWFWAPW